MAAATAPAEEAAAAPTGPKDGTSKTVPAALTPKARSALTGATQSVPRPVRSPTITFSTLAATIAGNRARSGTAAGTKDAPNNKAISRRSTTSQASSDAPITISTIRLVAAVSAPLSSFPRRATSGASAIDAADAANQKSSAIAVASE